MKHYLNPSLPPRGRKCQITDTEAVCMEMFWVIHYTPKILNGVRILFNWYCHNRLSKGKLTCEIYPMLSSDYLISSICIQITQLYTFKWYAVHMPVLSGSCKSCRFGWTCFYFPNKMVQTNNAQLVKSKISLFITRVFLSNGWQSVNTSGDVPFI